MTKGRKGGGNRGEWTWSIKGKGGESRVKAGGNHMEGRGIQGEETWMGDQWKGREESRGKGGNQEEMEGRNKVREGNKEERKGESRVSEG